MIYLDHNATSPMRPAAISAMQNWLGIPANPSSIHSFGREAKKELENSRKTIAEYLSAFPSEIIFTASGTEANVTALQAFPDRQIIVSDAEHFSVLKNTNYELRITNYETGTVNLQDLQEKLAKSPPALVSVMLANNETGIINPIKEVAEICHKHGAILHCDGVQALGKIPIDFSLLGADMLTISAHKIGGGVGAAALIVKNNLAIKPLFAGGQELGRRAGTENIAAISAFAAAVSNIDLVQMEQIKIWLNAMETNIEEAGGEIIGKNALRLPNTSNIIMKNVDNQVQLMNFDLGGFAVSAGAACSSGRVEVSHVLLAMGIPKETATCSIRVSAGWNTRKEDIEKFTAAWISLKNRLGK